jgi:hypothetical protein
VTAVHEEVQERTGQEKEKRQCIEEVRAVLAQKQDDGHGEEGQGNEERA